MNFKVFDVAHHSEGTPIGYASLETSVGVCGESLGQVNDLKNAASVILSQFLALTRLELESVGVVLISLPFRRFGLSESLF